MHAEIGNVYKEEKKWCMNFIILFCNNDIKNRQQESRNTYEVL